MCCGKTARLENQGIPGSIPDFTSLSAQSPLVGHKTQQDDKMKDKFTSVHQLYIQPLPNNLDSLELTVGYIVLAGM